MFHLPLTILLCGLSIAVSIFIIGLVLFVLELIRYAMIGFFSSRSGVHSGFDSVDVDRNY